MAATTAPGTLGTDAVSLLRDLIRINTVNPPGNERAAQEMLRDLLTEAGFECDLLCMEPDRPNLVARLRGREEGPSMALICHVDTVPAEPSEWTHDPWSGDLEGDYVWGRGALDMKDQVASEATACLALARSGWRPARGDLLFVCTADEETGAHKGAQYLCSEHPDKVKCEMVVNEGAGVAIDYDGKRFFTLAVGEKGVFRFHARTNGIAGHASLPAVGDNALLKLAPLLERLREQPEPEATPDTLAFLEKLLGERPDDLRRALAEIRDRNQLLGDLLASPMLGVTLTPTMASGSGKINVVPSMAEIAVDCRVPPELGEDEVRKRIQAVLGDDGYEIEFIEKVVGNRSDFGGPLAEAITEWVDEVEPGAQVLPLVMPGFSDSHWFRKAFGATVYGFCPQNAMTLEEAVPLVHGADERVATDDVALMANCFYALAKKVLGE